MNGKGDWHMNKIRFSLAHVKMDTEIAFIVQETCLT